VDGKRQQNVGISLSRLSQRGLSSDEIAQALLHCNETILTSDVLSSMIKILPTKEEMETCRNYEGEGTLGKVEQFFARIADVPHLTLRVEAMIAKHQLEDQTDEVRSRMLFHETASKQVRLSLDEKQGELRKILSIMLRAGNYINGGTRRGGAYGIKLDSISKMASVKTTDNKSNLLRYCAIEMRRLHGQNSLEQLSKSLDGMDDASKSTLDEVKAGIAKISKGIKCMTLCLEKNLSKQDDDDDDDVDGKKDTATTADKRQETNSKSVDRCFTNFLTYAEGVRDGLSGRYKTVEEEGARIVKLFAEDSKKVSSSQVYSLLASSLKLVERADAANKREIEKAKKAEKRAAKMEQTKSKQKAHKQNSGGGTFEAHDLFQSGGANDIVARVRMRQKKQRKEQVDSDDFESDEEDTMINRPPPPPKPPPMLAEKFKV